MKKLLWIDVIDTDTMIKKVDEKNDAITSYLHGFTVHKLINSNFEGQHPQSAESTQE